MKMIKAQNTNKFDGRKILKIVLIVSLSAAGLAMVYPLFFMFMAGFFTKSEYWREPLSLIPIPKYPTLQNYIALFTMSQYPMIGIYFRNSIIRTLYNTGMTVFTTLICAYVFSRLRFRGSKTVFLIMLFATMLPSTVTMIPTYLMYAKWPLSSRSQGLLDTWWIYLMGGPSINIMATFVVKQYLDTIPTSLDESAKIDGANTFTIMLRIILPVAKPVFAYIVISTAIGAWNDWATAFFYTSSDELQLLTSAISRLSINASAGLAVPDYPKMITLGLLVTIPALIIYIAFQKYIVEGLASAGIKG